MSKSEKKKESTDISNKRIKAISLYSPKVIQPRSGDMKDLVELIAGRSNLNESTIFSVLKELGAVIPYFFQEGRAVKIDSLGTFTLRIALDGLFSISHLPDKNLKATINTPHWFKGTIKNKDMIGKTTGELVERWNREHPDDPIK